MNTTAYHPYANYCRQRVNVTCNFQLLHVSVHAEQLCFSTFNKLATEPVLIIGLHFHFWYFWTLVNSFTKKRCVCNFFIRKLFPNLFFTFWPWKVTPHRPRFESNAPFRDSLIKRFIHAGQLVYIYWTNRKMGCIST